MAIRVKREELNENSLLDAIRIHLIDSLTFRVSLAEIKEGLKKKEDINVSDDELEIAMRKLFENLGFAAFIKLNYEVRHGRVESLEIFLKYL